MRLRKVSIISYKNIHEATLLPSPKINCLIGPNGAGKTNVLDALFFLSFCRSATTTADAQVIRHGDDFFVLEGEYERQGGQSDSICCSMKRGSRKHLKRNGKEYHRLSQHIGLLPLVMVSPSDTMLIAGGSDHRRRLMDMVIAQYDNTYIDLLGRYNKALQQRNTLLKAEEEPDVQLLDIYEQQMAETGELVSSKRADLVRLLRPVFYDLYGRIAGSGESVTLDYESHCAQQPLREALCASRQRDRLLGFTTRGVHRDDLVMTLDGYPMKSEGSSGQNKTFVTALKLAQLDLITGVDSARARLESAPTIPHSRPILLLDDIFDKLDSRRVERIMGIVAGERCGQIFITHTDRRHLTDILSVAHADYKLFNVADGNVTTI